MRTFWMGLAVLAMAATSWASDAPDVKIGDWVKTSTTVTTPEMPPGMPQMPVLTTVRVVGIDVEADAATLEEEVAMVIPGMADPVVMETETREVPLHTLVNTLLVADTTLDIPDDVDMEVAEEGKKTVVAGGKTYENVPWRKTRMSAVDEEGGYVGEMEVWIDPGEVMPLARYLKVTMRNAITARGEVLSDVTIVIERLGYGRK